MILYRASREVELAALAGTLVGVVLGGLVIANAPAKALDVGHHAVAYAEAKEAPPIMRPLIDPLQKAAHKP